MSTRFSLLFASAAIAAVSTPALAHEPQHDGGQHHDVIVSEVHSGDYDGAWQGDWHDGETWRDMWNGTYTDAEGRRMEGQYTGMFHGDGRFVTDDGQELLLGDEGHWHADGGHREGRGYHHGRELGASPDGRLGYTLAQREAWLAECRYVMSDGGYYDDGYYARRDSNGDVIGGLLGAVVGGVAGNRIADGNRLAGTLIGAGVGGIAGAVIGSAIDGDGRRSEGREISADELWAARYCDAYLRRYEMGGGAGTYGHAQMQPVMMVQMAAPAHGRHGHRHGPDCTTTVREEWVEVETPAPAPRARRTVPRPAPAPEPQGKVTPID